MTHQYLTALYSLWPRKSLCSMFIPMCGLYEHRQSLSLSLIKGWSCNPVRSRGMRQVNWELLKSWACVLLSKFTVINLPGDHCHFRQKQPIQLGEIQIRQGQSSQRYTHCHKMIWKFITKRSISQSVSLERLEAMFTFADLHSRYYWDSWKFNHIHWNAW